MIPANAQSLAFCYDEEYTLVIIKLDVAALYISRLMESQNDSADSNKPESNQSGEIVPISRGTSEAITTRSINPITEPPVPIWKRTWFKFAAILGILVAIAAILEIPNSMMNWILNLRSLSEKSSESQRTQWLPPELPKDCKSVSLVTGGGDQTVQLSSKSHSLDLFVITQQRPDGTFQKVPIISAMVTNNRIYPAAVIQGEVTNGSFKIVGDKIEGRLPPQWQMNKDVAGIEIVNRDLSPVYQAEYYRPDVIEINGVFVSGGQFHVITKNGIKSSVRPFGSNDLSLVRRFEYPETVYPGKRRPIIDGPDKNPARVKKTLLQPGTPGNEMFDQTIDFHQGIVSYQGTSLAVVTALAGTNSVRLYADSTVYFKRPQKFRAESSISLVFNNSKIAESKYRLVAKDGTVNIYHWDRREYITITNAVLDLLQRHPENDPLKQLAMALLKPYQFILNTDRATLLSMVSRYDSPKYDPPRTILGWQELVRSADKWPKSKDNPTQYEIPVELVIDDRGLVVESRAKLTQLFHFMGSNTNYTKHLGPVALLVITPGYVEAQTKYDNIVLDAQISDEFFDFIPEKDARQVRKLSPAPTFNFR